MTLTKDQARNFLVWHHYLSDCRPLSGKEGILEYINQVGCIQYDPLNPIGRNADLVLQARITDYREDMLYELLYHDRLLIDAWDKMMSIYHRDDWPYMGRVRESMSKQAMGYMGKRGQLDALDHQQAVISHLAERGASNSKGINLGKSVAGSWGNSSVSGVVLDYLFHLGKVGVSKKISTNKVFDLIENLLPNEILDAPDPHPADHDFQKWYILRRVRGAGLLWNKSGGWWLGEHLNSKPARQRILDELVYEGLLQIAQIEGIADKFYAAPNSQFSILNSQLPHKVRFIAPLDNFIWDRELISAIFDFDYTWEVYTPVAKRKFGYYVLPVLCGNRFVARFEPEKHKTQLGIKSWWWEADVVPTDELADAVMTALKGFAACFGKTEGLHEGCRDVIRGT